MPRKKEKQPKLEEELEVDARAETAAVSSAPDLDGARKRDEDEDVDLEGSGVFDAEAAGEPDPQAIDDLTDRIFGSVLSRYGWQRHGNRIEHVGEARARR